MNHIKSFVILSILLSIFSCKESEKKDALFSIADENHRFSDTVLQRIYIYQDQRKTADLLIFLLDENPIYRHAAAMAFASVQDSSAVIPLAAMLSDAKEEVKYAATFSLGQIRNEKAEPHLIKAMETEFSPTLQAAILEAIGKCGGAKGHTFLENFKLESKNNDLVLGYAWGLTRYAMRGIFSDKATLRALDLLCKSNMENVEYVASQYFVGLKEMSNCNCTQQLVDVFNSQAYIYTKANLVMAIGKARSAKSLDFLNSVAATDQDYRVHVNVITALREYEYKKLKDVVFKYLESKNINIVIRASEYLIEKGISEDELSYFDRALKMENWRVRANLLNAALKYSVSKTNISKKIIELYNASNNVYEKAFLIRALGEDIANFEFVQSQIASDNELVIKSYAMEAIVTMRRSPAFEASNNKAIAQGKTNLINQFGELFKRALLNGDVALVSLAADVIRDPLLNYKSYFPKTDFLKQAIDKLQLPRDIEAYIELQKTIDFFDGSKTELPKLKSNPIDWYLVTCIPPQQLVKIKTTKGNIFMKLLINESPGTVANFVKLAMSGYFTNNKIHRVVPNFVIQTGCPRGDGWGGPNTSIRSEFEITYYEEGSVGMASAGKDTESSQWFITHSPTSRLDGRYTIFAKVERGMEAVHKMEIGDKILDVQFVSKME